MQGWVKHNLRRDMSKKGKVCTLSWLGRRIAIRKLLPLLYLPHIERVAS